MFLVAIGLHGLLLFVPMGGASDAELIEDVELSELPTDAKAKATPDAPAGPLPVPNLNIAAGGGAVPAKPAAAAATAARRAATARVPRQPSAAMGGGARARATSTTQAATGPATGRAAQRGASGRSGSAGSTGTSASSGTTAARNSAPRTNLPNLNAASGSETESRSAGGDRTPGSTITLAGLIDSVTKSAPDALESLRSDFAEDYTYASKDTDAAGLDDRRSRWIDKISLLASADSRADTGAASTSAASTGAAAEKMEPIVLDDRKLSYPIEHSVRSDRRASRICLDDPRPNDAEVALLLDAQGNVVGTPEMTRSSGYAAIDKEIIAIVLAEGNAIAAETEDALAINQPKAYLSAFEIDYTADHCLTLPKLKK